MCNRKGGTGRRPSPAGAQSAMTALSLEIMAISQVIKTLKSHHKMVKINSVVVVVLFICMKTVKVAKPRLVEEKCNRSTRLRHPLGHLPASRSKSSKPLNVSRLQYQNNRMRQKRRRNPR